MKFNSLSFLANDFLKINYRNLVIIAYIFLCVPILLFFIGWLNLFVGITCSIALLYGLYHLIKNEYDKNEYFTINYISILLLACGITFWVSISGTGGFWTQMADWHWRNAIFRDLIDYTWPVIYPETGNALVYYFNFFLPAAAFGKMFGWKAANIFAFLYTIIGLLISYLLIIKYLKLEKVYQVIVLLFIFITWSGLEVLRIPILNDVIGIPGVGAYLFHSNHETLRWVVNQALAPWIAVPLYLSKRSIRTYVFLGMCVFAWSPFPFVGLFVFFALDGVYQLRHAYKCNITQWFKDVLSVENLIALTVFVCYVSYFFANSEVNGQNAGGGFGLYLPYSDLSVKKRIANLITFYFFNFIIYSLILWEEKKNDYVFWSMNLIFLLVPLFRVGSNWDFVLRAGISAQFVQMIFAIDYVLNKKTRIKKIGFLFLVAALSIVSVNVYRDTFAGYRVYKETKGIKGYVADGICSLSNKLPQAYYFGFPLNVYLCPNPETKLFYRFLSDKKSESEYKSDLKVLRSNLQKRNFCLVSGDYQISPKLHKEWFLINEKGKAVLSKERQFNILSNTVFDGKYEVYFYGPQTLKGPSGSNMEEVYIDNRNYAWANPHIDKIYLFQIKKCKDYYMIIWDDKYALTYLDGKIIWTKINNNDESQFWDIASVKRR